MSRVKKLVLAGMVVAGVVGMAAPATAEPLIHQELTVDPAYLDPVPVPGEGNLISICLIIGSGGQGPANCIRL